MLENFTQKSNNTDKEKTKGGRIDLLIRTENAYIVIENKIKSDINSNKQGEKQLNRYRAYVNYRIIGDYIDALGDIEEIKNIKEKYNNLSTEGWKKWKEDNERKSWEEELNKIFITIGASI